MKILFLYKTLKINYLKKLQRISKEDIAYAAQYNLEYNMIKIINHFIPKNHI